MAVFNQQQIEWEARKLMAGGSLSGFTEIHMRLGDQLMFFAVCSAVDDLKLSVADSYLLSDVQRRLDHHLNDIALLTARFNAAVSDP